MIVRHNQAGHPVGNSIRKHLSRMSQNAVQRADSYCSLGDQPLPAVQAEGYTELLLLGADIL